MGENGRQWRKVYRPVAEHIFDAATGRYRSDTSGRFVSTATVRDAVDQLADGTSERLMGLSARLMRGSIDLKTWQRSSMAVLKEAHVAAGVVAHGGREQMTPARWGAIGARIRAEYGYLRTFAEQLSDGSQPMDGRVVARSQMYGQGTRTTFTRIVALDQKERGNRSERNILSAAEHCEECMTLTAQGWQPIGSLPLPGHRACRSNCRCRLAYSAVEAEAA